MKKQAFTLAELIVVISIIIVLAGASIIGTAGIIKNLRFANAFNRLVFMVQEARSRAVTSRGTAAAYIVTIAFTSDATTSKKTITLTENPAPTSGPPNIDSNTLDTAGSIIFSAKDRSGGSPGSACSSSASIRFERKTARATLTCNGTVKNLMEFGIEETGRTPKSFLIHQAAGIPQLE